MRARGFPAWLAAAALALPLLGLWLPLIEVDDARYAEVPRAMAASGDWTVPTLNGMPYVEKPPLWYWTAASSYKVFGVSEAAARLPMALFAALGALAAAWMGTWLYGAAVGRAAAAACATSTLWVFLAHNMTLDMPLSACLAWTSAFVLRTLDRPEDARWSAPAAWACAALAFLAKGLIALVFPFAWVAGLALLDAKRRAGALKLLSPLGLALFALIAAPWFLAVQARRPDFLHTFFVEQHFQRYLTPRYSRGGHWAYYAAVLPLGLLPWAVPALAGTFRCLRDRRDAALAAWIAGVTAFFTLSHSKLPTYILPVLPHAAVLAAAALSRGLDARTKSALRWTGAALALLAVAGLAAPFCGLLPAKAWPPSGLALPEARLLAVLGAAFLAALGAAQWLAARSTEPARVLALGGLTAGALAFAGLGAASPALSAKALALAAREELGEGAELWTYGTYLHGLPFYTGREVAKLVYFVGEFHYAQREPRHARRFGDDDEARALPRREGRTVVALRAFEKPHFSTQPRPGSIARWRDFGRWSLAVVDAAPAPSR